MFKEGKYTLEQMEEKFHEISAKIHKIPQSLDYYLNYYFKPNIRKIQIFSIYSKNFILLKENILNLFILLLKKKKVLKKAWIFNVQQVCVSNQTEINLII